MNCKKARKVMSTFMDDEVNPRLKMQLQAHLAGCEGCRRELVVLQGIGQSFGKIEDISVSTAFSTIIMDRVDELNEKKIVGLFRPSPALVPITAMALMVMVIFFNIMTFTFALSSQPTDVRSKVVQHVVENVIRKPAFLNAQTFINYCSSCHTALCACCNSGSQCDMSQCGGK